MTEIPSQIRELQAKGLLRAIDAQFAAFVARVCDPAPPSVALAAALASRAVGEGHTGCDLAALAGRPFPGTEEAEGAAWGSVPTLPPLDAWRTDLRSEAARCCVGGPDDGRPLVLDGARLSLRRYWTYERRVRDALLRLAASEDGNIPLPTGLEDRLARYFPAESGRDDGSSAQREAARKAFQRRLSILSGGPGTGKTYTLARMVALLAELQPAGAPLRVRVAAPTGKAAARVVESLRKAKAEVPASAVVLAQIPEEASTLHRLLGSLPDSPYFRHDRDHPLDADVVVVDEASMVDLPLMAKLLDALPPACRLVLVGDRDQLASVEPGRVYGDLCEAAASDPRLRPCLTQLTYSRRFGSETSIGRLAAIVQAGAPHPGSALQSLCGPQLAFHDGSDGLDERFRSTVAEGYREFLQATEPLDVLRAAGGFRVLCAVVHGPCGVDTVNRLVRRALLAHRSTATTPAPDDDHRLIMVTVNDYSLGLYNGDVGVLLRDPATGTVRAWFEGDPAPVGAGCRSFPPSLLPTHETAFAMTVHKSQGSEFERVALVLPTSPDSPVLSRELLYTGITRTRTRLDLWCTPDVFAAAVQRRARQASGLFV